MVSVFWGGGIGWRGMRALKNLFFKWQMTQLRCFPTERLVRWGPGLDALGQTLKRAGKGSTAEQRGMGEPSAGERCQALSAQHPQRGWPILESAGDSFLEEICYKHLRSQKEP